MVSIKTPVHILGSCATRDAFEYPFASPFELADYTARTSLASLACKANEVSRIIEHIGPTFQKRMVHRDMTKYFWDALPDYRSGVLLIDLIDDRFRLDIFPDHSAHTRSAEYSRARRVWPTAPRQTLAHTSSAYRTLWDQIAARLASEVVKHGGLKVLVNCVYYTPTLAPEVDKSHKNDDMNTYLARSYRQLGAVFGSDALITYPEGTLATDTDHKWGAAPFHYAQNTYQHFISEMTARLT
ncbi:DUF6270 domain-containing protein [Sulfitobacter sp. F26169L]|uniref:DUF6270 domain-containing protein n=1 Tax=Sulfitobacter sp. F26169L TaxID=2996015 RepID=UPI002260F3CF|nr:DUF6270 domain-containing protein [Sulfitobacter sp. F26169L]MCX7565304.1 DUF6270 domain-containing protein [Sulfitobacter sp. F26169L]